MMSMSTLRRHCSALVAWTILKLCRGLAVPLGFRRGLVVATVIGVFRRRLRCIVIVVSIFCFRWFFKADFFRLGLFVAVECWRLLRNWWLSLRLSQQDVSQGVNGLGFVVVGQVGGCSERVLKVFCSLDDAVGLGKFRHCNCVVLEAHHIANPLLVCSLHNRLGAAVMIEAGASVVALAGIETPGRAAAWLLVDEDFCAWHGDGRGRHRGQYAAGARWNGRAGPSGTQRRPAPLQLVAGCGDELPRRGHSILRGGDASGR